MSIKLMSACWELSLPPGEKLVLLALADQANDEGRNCWPSLRHIAHRSGQNERTVRRALRALELKGCLTKADRAGTSSQYHIHPGHYAPSDKSPPRTKTTKTPDTMPPKPLEPSIINKEERARLIPDDWQPSEFGGKSQCNAIVASWSPDERETIVEHFIAHHQSKRTKATDWQPWWKTWVINSNRYGKVKNNGRQANGQTGSASSDKRSSLARAIDEGLDWIDQSQASVS